MIELDKRMELRLNALIATKRAIAPAFCAGRGVCDRSCPLYKDDLDRCYWLDALTAIEDLEMIMSGYGCEINHNTKPERSTKEQSRFDDIIV